MEIVPRHQCLANSPCESVPLSFSDLDVTILNSLEPIRNLRFLEWLTWITNGLPGLTLMILAVLLFWRASSERPLHFKNLLRNYPLMIFTLIAMGLSDLSSSTLKKLIGRIKPLVEDFAAHPRLSFPSNHAFNTAFAMSLAFVLLQSGMKKPQRFLLMATAFASFVAFTRMLLWEHFLSDVMAGLILGAGYGALFGQLGLRFPGHRFDVPDDGPSAPDDVS